MTEETSISKSQEEYEEELYYFHEDYNLAEAEDH